MPSSSRPSRVAHPNPGASLIRRVVCYSPSDVEPDDDLGEDRPTFHGPAVPPALGAPRSVSLKIPGMNGSGPPPDSYVTISDNEEHSFPVLTTRRLSRWSPGPTFKNHPLGLPLNDKPPPEKLGHITPVSPTQESASAAPSCPDLGPPAKDSVVCHLHFQASTPSKPRIIGPFSARPRVATDHERQVGARINALITFRPEPIEPHHFATYFSSVCDDVRPPEENWGRQLELFARSCRSLIGFMPAVKIFMRGLKVFPDLPSSIMRRVLRSFYYANFRTGTQNFDGYPG